MLDLYKRLNLDPQANENAIREQLRAHPSPETSLDPQLIQAAQHILLHPKRRAVYDRNYQVLCTIGQLRSHLGMNLRPFWARANSHDFTRISAPHTPPTSASTDPVAVIRAASTGRRRRTRHRRLKRLTLLVVILLLTLLALRYVGLLQ